MPALHCRNGERRSLYRCDAGRNRASIGKDAPRRLDLAEINRCFSRDHNGRPATARPLEEAIPRSGAKASVFAWLFNAIDDQNLDGAFGGLELEAELFLKR